MTCLETALAAVAGLLLAVCMVLVPFDWVAGIGFTFLVVASLGVRFLGWGKARRVRGKR